VNSVKAVEQYKELLDYTRSKKVKVPDTNEDDEKGIYEENNVETFVLKPDI
jgi:hypothetical protein